MPFWSNIDQNVIFNRLEFVSRHPQDVSSPGKVSKYVRNCSYLLLPITPAFDVATGYIRDRMKCTFEIEREPNRRNLFFFLFGSLAVYLSVPSIITQQSIVWCCYKVDRGVLEFEREPDRATGRIWFSRRVSFRLRRPPPPSSSKSKKTKTTKEVETINASRKIAPPLLLPLPLLLLLPKRDPRTAWRKRIENREKKQAALLRKDSELSTLKFEAQNTKAKLWNPFQLRWHQQVSLRIPTFLLPLLMLSSKGKNRE